MIRLRIQLYLLNLLNILVSIVQAGREYTILHASHFNGVFEPESNPDGEMVGGLARVQHYLQQIPKKSFIYTGSFIRAPVNSDEDRLRIEVELFGMLKPTVVVLGENEYRLPPENFSSYIKSENLRIISTNVRLPRIKNALVLPSSDVAFVAYTDTDVKDMPALESTNTEVTDITTSLIKTIDLMKDSLGDHIFIAAGCVGYDTALELAKKSTNVDIFISGCSHTLQWHDHQPPEDLEKDFDYPVTVKNAKNRNVIIAHSYGSTKFLGRLLIKTNGEGTLLSHSGTMVYLGSNVPEDKDIKGLLKNLDKGELGKTKVYLNGNCKSAECNLGNMVADAFIQHKCNNNKDLYWTDTPIALVLGASIDDNINASSTDGTITLNHLSKVFTQQRNLVTVEIRGASLYRTIGEALHHFDEKKGSDKFLQVSGLSIRYDSRKPHPKRIISMKARCSKCEIPSYFDLKPTEVYTIVTTEDFARGAFGHDTFKKAVKIIMTENITDFEVVRNYITGMKMINARTTERIMIIKQESWAQLLKSKETITFGVTFLTYLVFIR